LGGGVIPIFFIDGPGEAAAYVQRHRLPLQAVAVAVAIPSDAAVLATTLGAVRSASFGTLQDPPLAGHHGGRARIADFIRWVDFA
jgi:hypothetical protein